MSDIVPFKDFIRSEMVVNRFAEVLGEQNARSYVNSVALAVANDEKLQECTPLSIMSAALQAATLRLSVDKQLREAALVPYWDNKRKVWLAQLIPQYKGLQNLALRTGEYRYINTGKVYEGEEIVFDRLSGAARFTGQRSGDKIKGWFASFQLYTGFSKTVYMSVEEIHEHAKRYSKGYTNPYGSWTTNTADMERKTPLRQLLTKWAPMRPGDAQMLAEIEDHAFQEIDDDEYVSGLVLPEASGDEPRKDADTLIGELTGEAPKKKTVTREDVQQEPLFEGDLEPAVISDDLLDKLVAARLGTTDKEKIAEALGRSAFLSADNTEKHYKFWLSQYLTGRKSGLEQAEAADKADGMLADLVADEV